MWIVNPPLLDSLYYSRNGPYVEGSEWEKEIVTVFNAGKKIQTCYWVAAISLQKLKVSQIKLIDHITGGKHFWHFDNIFCLLWQQSQHTARAGKKSISKRYPIIPIYVISFYKLELSGLVARIQNATGREFTALQTYRIIGSLSLSFLNCYPFGKHHQK